MLYLQHTAVPQAVRIPRNGDTPDGNKTMVLRSTINLDNVVNAVVIDTNTLRNYYYLSVQLPADAPEGEYEYTLAVGETVLSSGLAIVGGEGNPFQQTTKTIQYEQYATTE